MKTKLKKSKFEALLLVAVTLFSTLLILQEIPTAKADTVTDAITAGLDWLDNMAYLQINDTHAVALESPSLSFRIHRSDGYWTIFGKKDNLNLPPSATMIRGGCLDPQATTDDLGLITGSLDRQRMKYKFDIDGDGDYNDVVLYVEYATMTNTNTRVSGKVVGYVNKGLSLSLQLETTQVLATVSLNQQFSIDKDRGWAGRRYTIRPTTKGLADLYVWLGTTQFSWLNGQTYQQMRGINYLDRALKLYRTWYGSGYIIDRFDGMYGATLTVRPYAGQYGIPNYPPNPDLILEPNLPVVPPDYSTYYVGSPTSNWYSYANASNSDQVNNVLRSTTVSRHMMPDDEHWNNCPFQCTDTQFSFAYRSRTGFSWARNQYIANGFEYDLKTFEPNRPQGLALPGIDVVLGIGTDAKSIRACADMAKYGVNIPYGNGLSTLREEFIDSAVWDGNGIASDAWHGTPIGWPYPGYGAHNTATYANALTQYYKLTGDANYGAKADQVIGVLMMLQNKIGCPVYSRAQSKSYYRAEFIGSFLPGYSVAYSFGQIDVYSAEWLDLIYGTLQFFGTFQVDPASACFPCLGNAECTIPATWALIQYRTTNRTPVTPQQTPYTLTLDNAVVITDHSGSLGGDGSTELISQNLQSQQISGNQWRHTGYIHRIRMMSNAGAFGGEGWSSIQYEWNFTLANPVVNWRTKAYFTIPDYYGFVGAGGNSLTVTAFLYTPGGSLITQDSRTPIDGLTGSTANTATGGKIIFYNDLAKTDTLSAGSYTIKLKFMLHSGGSLTRLNIGYTGDMDNSAAMPLGLEYFGYDTFNIEDFTTYTKVDPNNDITVASNSLTVDTMRRDVSAYVYKDKGTGHFNGDFEHLINVRLTAAAPDGNLMFWSLWNALGGEDALRPSNNGIEVMFYRTTSGTNYYILMREWYGNANYDSYWTGASPGTTYYLKIVRTGSTLTCKIYSDSARTNLLTTLSRTLHSIISYRYIYAVQSCASSYAPSATISGYSENLNLQEISAPPTTEDFTTYTENDPNSDITVTSSRATVDTIRRDVSAYVYKDKGTGYFSGNFEHLTTVKCTASDPDGCFNFWSLWNAIGGEDALRPSNNGIEIMFYRSTGGSTYYILMREWYGNVNYDSYYTINVGTAYYLKIARTGSTLTTKIYSDAARTSLLATLTLNLHQTAAYRYIYAVQSCASSYVPTATISGYSENLHL